MPADAFAPLEPAFAFASLATLEPHAIDNAPAVSTRSAKAELRRFPIMFEATIRRF